MPLITYNTNIPASGNNPSSDQPSLQTNTNNIPVLIAVDHYSFNDSLGGLHKQVTLVNESIPTTAVNQIAVYSKTSGQSQEFITSDLGAKEYQMTRFIDANFALFGKNTNNYNGVGTKFTGGWTFLPGGMLFQYGNFNDGVGGISPSTGTVIFPVAFTTASTITVTITPICKVGGTGNNDTFSLQNTTVSTTQFQWNAQTSTSAYVGFTWLAIGV